MVLILMVTSLMIIGLTAVSIWGLMPSRETNNFLFRSVVWLSRPARGGKYVRMMFIAIPVIYALFFSYRAGIPMVIAMTMLTVFNGRYLVFISRQP